MINFQFVIRLNLLNYIDNETFETMDFQEEYF